MIYLYEALEKPTRLYIKQCPHCGLKYFGKSTSENIETYRGSGTRWNNHLKKHNIKPMHLWNSDWYYDTSISRFALKFSHINKIVESKRWANLKEENGLEGGWDHINDGSKEHIDRTTRGGKNSGIGTRITKSRFKAGDTRTFEMSKFANEIKAEKLKTDENYKKDYYKKVSDYQKENNSMKDKCWCVPIGCKNKSKEMKVFHKEEIPEGWITCNQFNEDKKDKKNPAYGRMWIYNIDLKRNMYINKNDHIPEGWTTGRKMKF